MTPRVLVTVPDERRLAVVRELVEGLPEPALRLFAVVKHDEAARYLVNELNQ